MYCTAKVDGQWIQLILDSGSSGSVITKSFMEKINRKIDRQSSINMVGIHGDKKKALGEISNLPITIQDNLLPIDVVVSEATGYDVLVGNDWFIKYQAILDWRTNELRFKSKNQEYKQPASCWKKLQITVIEDSDDEFEEELLAYYQLEAQQTMFTANDDGLTMNDQSYSWDYIEWVQQYNDCPDDECTKSFPCQQCDEDEFLRQETQLLAPAELKKPEKPPDALTIKYFDNDGRGRQPAKAWDTDAGLDLYYIENQPTVLRAHSTTPVNTYIAFEIPYGTYAQIASRSSLAKKGITATGGVCDAGYTGDIVVLLHNSTDHDYSLQRNDKIAQIIFLPLVEIGNLQRVEKRDQLQASGRQQKGFGSSDQQQLLAESASFSVGEIMANQQKQLNKLLEEYQDLFSKNLGKCGIVRHEVDTGQERPIRQNAYQRPPA